MESIEEARARLLDVAPQLAAELWTINALIDELASLVDAAVKSDAQVRTILTRLELYSPPRYRDAREIITKRLYQRLGALRPYIPFEPDPDKE